MAQHRMKYCRLIFVMLFALVVSGLTVGAAEPDIYFSTQTVRPGDFLEFKIKALPDSKVKLNFMGQTKEVFPQSKPSFWGLRPLFLHLLKRDTKMEMLDFKALVAVSYRTQPGNYPLGVEVTRGTDVKNQEWMIEVKERRFPEQRITISDKMFAETTDAEKSAYDDEISLNARLKGMQLHLAPLWRGGFIEPVEGRRSSEFGVIRYVNGTDRGQHAGWDIAAPAGNQVSAIGNGLVVYAGTLNATGNTIIIYHGMDLFSAYGHLSKIEVKEGEKVAWAEKIGLVGSTGRSTGPHLHFTVRIGDVPIDPALVLHHKINWRN